jgi:hypothetical protein
MSSSSKELALKQAYIRMAERLAHRPAMDAYDACLRATGRGHLSGSADVSDGEAAFYATCFLVEEGAGHVSIGESKPPTERVCVWTIEAARALANGHAWLAICLLEMALEEARKLEDVRKQQEFDSRPRPRRRQAEG